MFQLSYKLRIAERVKAGYERHLATTLSETGGEASRAAARPASLSMTSSRQDFHSTPRTASFSGGNPWLDPLNRATSLRRRPMSTAL